MVPVIIHFVRYLYNYNESRKENIMTVVLAFPVVLASLALGACQVINQALNYEPEKDAQPNKLWHRLIRRLNRWIGADDEGAQQV